MDIVSRARWGARYRRGFGPAPLPAKYVYLHHSVTIAPDLVWVDADGDGVEDDEERAMRTLEDVGQSRFGGGISYSFAVMPSGRVYEGHGVDRQGAHTKGLNSTARAIVLVGNYENADLTSQQYRAVAQLLQYGRARGWWTTARLTGGHRDAPGAQTACPGNRAHRAIPEINRLAAGALPSTSVEDTVSWVESLTFTAPDGKVATYQARDWMMWTNYAAWQAANNAANTNAKLDAIAGAVAAIANDPDVTADQLRQIVADHMPNAAQIADQLRPGLVAEVLAAVPDALSGLVADDVADEVLTRLGQKLAAPAVNTAAEGKSDDSPTA